MINNHGTQPSITCPHCGMTSYHPKDIEFGYCGNCHAFTSGDLVSSMATPLPAVPIAVETADTVWEHLPWPAQVVVVVILILLVLGLIWLVIWGEV
jgi:hypothetical protein